MGALRITLRGCGGAAWLSCALGAAPGVQAILNGILTWQTVVTAQRLRAQGSAPQAA